MTAHRRRFHRSQFEHPCRPAPEQPHKCLGLKSCHLLLIFGITSANYLYTVQIPTDVRTTDVLLDTPDAFRAWNGDNPRLLRQQPTEGDAGGSVFFLASSSTYSTNSMLCFKFSPWKRGMAERKSVLSNFVSLLKRPVSIALPSGLNVGTKPMSSSSNVGSSSASGFLYHRCISSAQRSADRLRGRGTP